MRGGGPGPGQHCHCLILEIVHATDPHSPRVNTQHQTHRQQSPCWLVEVSLEPPQRPLEDPDILRAEENVDLVTVLVPGLYDAEVF